MTRPKWIVLKIAHTSGDRERAAKALFWGFWDPRARRPTRGRAPESAETDVCVHRNACKLQWCRPNRSFCRSRGTIIGR